MIIAETNGEKSLDEFMQNMYNQYYVKLNRGFTEAEFQKELEGFLARNLDAFFADFIYGTKPLDYTAAFAAIGLNVDKLVSTAPFFGTSLSESEGKLLVKRVQRESAAEQAGISVNDEIVAINGFRTNQSGFNDFIGRIQVGQSFEVLVSRDGKIMTLQASMGEMEKVNYSYTLNDDKNKMRLLDFWLREK
jgi:predicted metalloprotease with PDZ domain